MSPLITKRLSKSRLLVMPAILPPFDCDCLIRFTTCTHINTEVDKIQGAESIYAYSEYSSSTGIPILIGVQIECESDYIHLHIDTVRKDVAPPPPKHWQEMDIAELLTRVQVLLFNEHTCTTYDGVFELQKETLPSGGLVESLLEVLVHSSGSELQLVGTTFSIDNDEPLSLIKWSYDNEKELLTTTISAEEHSVPLEESFMVNAVDYLTRGIDRYVFEKQEETTKGNIDEPDVPKKAQA